jgi:hypothetical protein
MEKSQLTQLALKTVEIYEHALATPDTTFGDIRDQIRQLYQEPILVAEDIEQQTELESDLEAAISMLNTLAYSSTSVTSAARSAISIMTLIGKALGEIENTSEDDPQQYEYQCQAVDETVSMLRQYISDNPYNSSDFQIQLFEIAEHIEKQYPYPWARNLTSILDNLRHITRNSTIPYRLMRHAILG